MKNEIKVQIINSINSSMEQARKDTGKDLRSYDLALRNFVNELTDEYCNIKYKNVKYFEVRINELIVILSDKKSPGYRKARDYLRKIDVHTLYIEYKKTYDLLLNLIYSGLERNNILNFKKNISDFSYYKMFDYFQSNGAINAALPYWAKYIQNILTENLSYIKSNDEVAFYNEPEDIVYTEYIFERQKTSNSLVKNVKKEAEGRCFFDCSNDIFYTEQGPYLEVHHIIPLNFSKHKSIEINLDCIENLVAICPTCHRRIHLEDKKSNKYIDYHKRLYNEVKHLAKKININTYEEYLLIV